ncbi:hypothetical protein ACFYT4_16725 [Streptomyces sp. NPDC004609]|uniref:hypothetical protein n=1 Tax=Streptomyces sp. NPDC004609 TaxID=3364704 RepID=UPI0036A3FC76
MTAPAPPTGGQRHLQGIPIATPTSAVAGALNALAAYTAQFGVIALRCDTALDHLRDVHRKVRDPRAADAALAERDAALATVAVELLLPHTQTLLHAARRGIDAMPPVVARR